MIDLDQLDEQLTQALADNLRTDVERPVVGRSRRSARPAVADIDLPVAVDSPVAVDLPVDEGVAATSTGDSGRGIAELLRAGRMAEADVVIAAAMEAATDDGGPLDRRDAAGWAAMRALLDGRADDARAAASTVLHLGREGNDPGAWSRYLLLRFWLALGWGDEDERYEVLDQCREQAYTYGDVLWRSALTLLLAHLGRGDEARQDFDGTLADIERWEHDGRWLDAVTNLAEAATALGDAERASVVQRLLARIPDQLVLSGDAWVAKRELAWYRAGLVATTGALPCRPSVTRPRHVRSADRSSARGPLLSTSA